MSSMKTRAAAIQQLEDRRGRVTAQKLVDAARNPRHPLHRDFLWDDRKCGAKWRLEQARTIINSVRILISVAHKKVSTVYYLRDPDAAAQSAPGYRNIVQIRSERDTAIEALLAETTAVAARLERAVEIAQALALQPEFQAALDGILTLQSRLRRGVSVVGGKQPATVQ